MRKRVAGGAVLTALVAALACALPSAGQEGGYLLTFMCADNYRDVSILRLRNSTDTERGYTWQDFNTGEEGKGTAPARSDTYFYASGYAKAHTVIAQIGGKKLTKATNRNQRCTTSLTVEKVVEGGTAPAGETWPFDVSGSSGTKRKLSFDEKFELRAGESKTLTVPATIDEGSIDVDKPYPGGYSYHVRETDPKGATVNATNTDFVASKDGKYVSTFTNRYPEPIPAPTPTPEPGPTPEPTPAPEATPPAATPPTSPPEPGPGPEPGAQPEPVAVGPGTVDLVLTKDVSPTRAQTGEEFVFTIRVTNRGPATATNVVGTESNKTDQTRLPVDILGVETSPGVTCSGARPVACRKDTLAPGETVQVKVRTRQNATGVLENFAAVSSDQPENNYTDNEDVAGIVVEPVPAVLRVAKTADRTRVRPGQTVTFTNTIRSAGRYEAVNVQACDRLPAGLGYRRAPAAVFSRGRACWFYPYLEPGERRRLVIRTRALNTSGRTITITNRTVVRAKRTRARVARSKVRVAGRQRGGGVTG